MGGVSLAYPCEIDAPDLAVGKLLEADALPSEIGPRLPHYNASACCRTIMLCTVTTRSQIRHYGNHDSLAELANKHGS